MHGQQSACNIKEIVQALCKCYISCLYYFSHTSN